MKNILINLAPNKWDKRSQPEIEIIQFMKNGFTYICNIFGGLLVLGKKNVQYMGPIFCLSL